MGRSRADTSSLGVMRLPRGFKLTPTPTYRLRCGLLALAVPFAPAAAMAVGTTTLPGEAPRWSVRSVEDPGVRWRLGAMADPEVNPNERVDGAASSAGASSGASGLAAPAIGLGPGGLNPAPAPSWTLEPRGPKAAPYTPPPSEETPPPPVLALRSISRGISVNGHPYPDVSIYVPNGYAQDKQITMSVGLSGTSRIRYCSTANQPFFNCADGEAMLEFTPFRGNDASLGFNWTLQSLSSRNNGTRAFYDAQSFGFRAAINLSPTVGLAIGGEQLIHTDNKTDLGHNFYAVLTQALPLGPGERPPLLIATSGVGSDFFAYGGNGSLGTINCGGGNSVTSTTYPTGTDCKVGPISSLSVAFNDRFAIGAEWFGYGLGAGFSLRPLRDVPLTLTLYAVDFLGNYPSYIAATCPDGACSTRYYGRFTYSF